MRDVCSRVSLAATTQFSSSATGVPAVFRNKPPSAGSKAVIPERDWEVLYDVSN
jgi:hypothetical protein